ncbi:MAG: poly-beta-1,6-N-acetyl-D-glucosamine N-deacetylase PgaB [Synechococcaceae cyanobacterium ELA739]
MSPWPEQRRSRSWSTLVACVWTALVCALGSGPPAQAGDPGNGGLLVLAYHEISEPAAALDPDIAVSPSQLAGQLSWLKQNGYHPVSVEQVLRARHGGSPLPRRPVLLSFDDGYSSFYSQAYPLLQQFRMPAVVAVVGRWLEPDHGLVAYGDKKLDRSRFLSWDQLRTMQASGLVEVASHTFDLHHGIVGNPQGNSEPATTTRAYRPGQGYETELSYQERIRADLTRNNVLLRAHLGHSPRVIVWPYGRYNATAQRIASDLGMPVGLNLDDGANATGDDLSGLRRILMGPELSSPSLLAQELDRRQHNADDHWRAAKVMHVDLDAIHDPSPAQTERNLSLLLARINAMGVNTVYLQAFADPDGDGVADALYFPNRVLPVRDDLFNHVAWEIRTRTRVRRLYAWMPVLAFVLPRGTPGANDRVVTLPNPSGRLAVGYRRLSPFSAIAMGQVRKIYQDLGRRATFDGLLFHDDVTLSDYEDGSLSAQKHYRQWGLSSDLSVIRSNPATLIRWSELKTDYLNQLTTQLGAQVRRNQPQLVTARNLYAQVVLNPHAQTWYSQSLPSALRTYDFTAVEAMPYMEKAADPRIFLDQLVAQVKATPMGLSRVVFELQSTDWASQRDLPSAELAQQLRWLYALGVRHVGYYPDSPFRAAPDPALIGPVLASHSSAPEPPR